MKSFLAAAAPADEQVLLNRAATWPEQPSLSDLTADVLRQITRREGVDFATALLFDRFRKSPRHEAFVRRIDSLLQDSSPPRRTLLDAKVVIVPGAGYREHLHVGSDGRLIREVAESVGLPTDMIPLASFGSVQHNAGLIRAWLKQHAGERLILGSLSKGSPDLKLALAGPDAPRLFRDVIAWVNVCGPLDGTRVADWILAGRLRTWFFRLKFRWQKRDFDFITELSRGPGGPLHFTLRLPDRMKLLSLVGFPLRRHITTRFSGICHRYLAGYGPNDGTTLLSDLSDWPGDIYPVWSADHYFRPEDQARRLIAAVLQYLSDDSPTGGTDAARTRTQDARAT